MRILTASNDTRNGNISLKDTDILFVPPTFPICNSRKGPRMCSPRIEGNTWKCCNYKDLIAGRPSVTMESYMVCIQEGGLITVAANGQMLPQQWPYGLELTAEQIKILIVSFFKKIGWTATEDIDNAEYIANCMKAAGMDTRMSIEFFLLSCCAETGKGKKLKEIGGSGLSFLQLTGLSSEQCYNIEEKGSEWRAAYGKPPLTWDNESPSLSEIKNKLTDRNELAWEGSIYYWCYIGIQNNKNPLNDYIAGYESGSNSEPYSQEGLYFAVQCFVNGAKTDGPTTKIREGNIFDYTIEENPSSQEGDYKFKEINGSTYYEAPNGSVERARVYMEYYDKEAPIWQFSEDILKKWDSIPT